ncbi:MAG: YqeG family HAD IIIA-type phosphatase [Armatimonadota bacterium]|nr:YqeG family HAD IIIA-type phosphatase [bacterium]MDW8320411.1 YqeG family HAD IIIA-type phosphatase [Armatimonadota bacterium]
MKKRGWLVWCPDEVVSSVSDIHPTWLVQQGVQAVLLDLDNTLVPWQRVDVPESVRQWIGEMKRAGLRLCLVSNTRRRRRLEVLAKRLGIAYVPRAFKPRRYGLRQALQQLKATPEQAVMIGDQMFTDVWGGNRMGMRTILVLPMARREFIGTKVSRLLERILLWAYQRTGALKQGAGTLATILASKK